MNRVFLILFLITAIPATAELRLEADLSERQLRVVEDGVDVGTYTVSVGKEENPTPTGTFLIRKIVWNPTWVPPNKKWARGKSPKDPWDPDNPMKLVKIFFREPDYYIHGTDDEDSLGRARSHGCIRMSVEDVEQVARLVMTHGGKPQPEPWYRRIFRSRATKVVRLAQPVEMVIVK